MNYPERVTIFTSNFWKLIVICNSWWLNLTPVYNGDESCPNADLNTVVVQTEWNSFIDVDVSACIVNLTNIPLFSN